MSGEDVIAHLRIATDVPLGTDYYKAGNESYRDSLELALDHEVDLKVSAYWTDWELVPLAGPDPTEAEVLAEIRSRVNAVVGPPALGLVGEPDPKPTRVRYVWRNGRRTRVHTYALAVDDSGRGSSTPWTMNHTSSAGDVTVAFSAELSWEVDW